MCLYFIDNAHKFHNFIDTNEVNKYKQVNIKKLIKISILALILLYGFLSYSQTGKKNHLAIGIFAGAQSEILTYAFISTRNGVIVSAQIVSEERFMLSALGYWPSLVNTQREDLFLKNNVDSCFLLTDENGKINGYYCKPFNDIWKIRFNEHPAIYDAPGWSQGQYKPSKAQMQYLQRNYGIKNILTEYIYGDSLYKLLRNIQDPYWIDTYKVIQEESVEIGQ